MAGISKLESDVLFKNKINHGLGFQKAKQEVERDKIFLKQLDRNIAELKKEVKILRQENRKLVKDILTLNRENSKLKKENFAKNLLSPGKIKTADNCRNGNVFHLNRIINFYNMYPGNYVITDVSKKLGISCDLMKKCFIFLEKINIIKKDKDRKFSLCIERRSNDNIRN